MKNLMLGVLLASVLIISGCSSKTLIHSAYDPSFNIPAKGTYRWEDKPTTVSHNERIKENIKAPVHAAVAREMSKKGFIYAQSGQKADLVLDYFPALAGQGYATTKFEGVDYMNEDVGHFEETDPNAFHKARLYLDIKNGANNQGVWRGYAYEEIKVNVSEDARDRLVNRLIREMLKEFPPKRRD